MNTPSSDELRTAVFDLLGKVNCEIITRKELTRDLESHNGWDLSTLKDNVKDFLNEYFVQTTQQPQENDQSNVSIDSEEENGGDKQVKKKAGGFSKPCQLSPQLAEFVGCDVLARTEVVRRMWAYIKEHDLQNPRDRREILCDAELQKVLKRKKVTMFQLNKVLSPMMKSVSELQDASAATEKKGRSAVVSSGSAASARPKKAEAKKSKAKMSSPLKSSKGKDKKDKPPSSNAFGGPVSLAAPLRVFLGGKHEQLARTEVTKLMWKYIKEHDLQNPANRREIVCDSKLRELFGADSFTMFQMASLLKPMLIKIEKTSE